MKTIEDLPFLKAQAAELERLIAIAPPSAVIAKVQYEGRLGEVRKEIDRLESEPQLVIDTAQQTDRGRQCEEPQSSKENRRDRLRDLLQCGCQIGVSDNADVPFGSLANAISRACNVAITIQSLEGVNIAVRYQVRTEEDALEQVILHAPNLDFQTRYSVAHELAHIALGHELHSNLETAYQQSNTLEEMETHALAATFLKFQGAPWQSPEAVAAALSS